MNKKSETIKFLFLILIGLILIAVGIGGNSINKNKIDQLDSKGSYRYINKSGKVTTIIPNSSPAPISSATEVPFQTKIPISSLKLSGQLDFGEFFVNSIKNPKLSQPKIPDLIAIPSINLITPVVISDFNFTKIEGETFGQWQAPSEFAAGWQPNSALLGEAGNTVINGHHNEFGEVFGKLIDLKEGDLIYVYSKGEKFTFIIANKMILPEKFQPPKVRLENAVWLGKTDDVRLTLVTCWPKDSNTHRLILVARPVLAITPIR